ncbi:branched-chain amino acid aminotransferase [Luteococcus sanguinis]|uniref:Branched-chain-amino-acid aminotransferase n=1 Tax=Luteococcus sanguinis TaxID=174038 RepID=A0ABW1WY02_9ACTN
MALDFSAPQNPTWTPEERIAEISVDPGFGDYFTDHMARATWSAGEGWSDGAVVPYGPIPMDPASAVLHYAQEIFEGLKAYKHADGSVWLFRPEMNARRFAASAHRLALPELSEEDFLAAVEALVRTDARWVPGLPEQSLYLRPFMIAHETFLGVRPAQTAGFWVIASPVGGYFKGGVAAVSIWVTTSSSRAGIGGTGAAKCGGNYAASLEATKEAYANGCNQVLFLDAAEQRWIEELGGMNLFVVTSAGELVTPELSGSILAGVTRDSILQLAPELGLIPVERRLELAEVFKGIQDGTIVEAFACGTAAVITPIRSFKDAEEEVVLPEVAEPASLKIRDALLDIQYGRLEDTHGWTRRVC